MNIDAEIYNAKITKWALERIYSDEPIRLTLTIKIADGSAVTYTLPMSVLESLFDILQINNINQLEGQPCLVLIQDHICRTIGNIMAVYTDNIKNDWLYTNEYYDLLKTCYLKSGRIKSL